jgi:hypothetical protein
MYRMRLKISRMTARINRMKTIEAIRNASGLCDALDEALTHPAMHV